MKNPKPICLRLLRHTTEAPRCLARLSAGKSIPAKIAIIAMTTSNSIKVNALWLRPAGRSVGRDFETGVVFMGRRSLRLAGDAKEMGVSTEDEPIHRGHRAGNNALTHRVF